jgi:hypothetical protein
MRCRRLARPRGAAGPPGGTGPSRPGDAAAGTPAPGAGRPGGAGGGLAPTGLPLAGLTGAALAAAGLPAAVLAGGLAPAGLGLAVLAGAGLAGPGRGPRGGAAGLAGLGGRGVAPRRTGGGGGPGGGGDTAGHSATSASAFASWCGCGRDTSRTRIAVSGVSFIPGMTASAASVARTSAARSVRPGQKICAHQGAGSHDIAADSAATAPGRSSVTCPAAASGPSRVPPR